MNLDIKLKILFTNKEKQPTMRTPKIMNKEKTRQKEKLQLQSEISHRLCCTVLSSCYIYEWYTAHRQHCEKTLRNKVSNSTFTFNSSTIVHS